MKRKDDEDDVCENAFGIPGTFGALCWFSHAGNHSVLSSNIFTCVSLRPFDCVFIYNISLPSNLTSCLLSKQ